MQTGLSQALAEVLEAAWTGEEQGVPLRAHIAEQAHTYVTPDLLAAGEAAGYLTSNGQGELTLTQAGRQQAAEVIRRHRLAERLVVDVLGMSLAESEAEACEFEHTLARGVTDAICTLLGHPRFCPHMRTIPMGECCRAAAAQIDPLLVTLEQLNLGEQARIAYVSAPRLARLQKLSALGLTPGAQIKLHQKTPSFVVQCEETQIALEKDIAAHIYVWRK